MPHRKVAKTAAALPAQENLLHRIASRIRQSLELEEILTLTVEEISEFLETDRVKIYRFESDGSGAVIAESIRGEGLPSLLGLHFPESDLPRPLREMFVKTRQRVIVDVASGRKTQERLDCPKTGKNLLREDISYLPVDPCHLDYLSAMGVCSSLVLPILHQNSLWGLLVSHHSKSRFFSEQELKMVQLVVDQVSIAIAQSHLLAQARQQAVHEATINQISTLLHSQINSAQIRQTVIEQIVKSFQGSGGRLYITAKPMSQSAKLYTCGEQPSLPWLEEMVFWQQIISNNPAPIAQNPPAPQIGEVQESIYSAIFPHPSWFQEKLTDNESPLLAQTSESDRNLTHKNLVPYPYAISDLYKEPQLQSLFPAFESTAIRSLLIVPLKYHQQCVGCLTIFRDESASETLWAGRSDRDERNLLPRRSFEAWLEVKKGQAREWQPDEIKFSQALGLHLYIAVMQQRVEETIRHQAFHDLLTGLPNRLLFSDRLSLALATIHEQGEMLAVVFLDLDGFKNINDTLGHAVGDQLLQNVAQRLKGALSEENTLARWGGDEFTILISPIQCADNAAQMAQQILQALSHPFRFGSRQEFYIKASIGIALAPYDGEDVETLLKHADAAMYRAKQQGRNNYQMYTPAIGTKALERLILENNLYKALARQEFLLHYQPQVDIKTGQIVGMEALIRWQHPERGLVSPHQFIPLAEETGLINEIGSWVLRTACTQNRRWQLAGFPPFRIAVNISARQFQNSKLVEMIAQVLAETELDPGWLEIEITESIAIQDINFTISVLQSLKKMGIHISMDDFGTGYSCLSSLKQLPLDSLKIDRSFIRDLLSDPSDAAIIKAVIALGHGLNLNVISEGVETAEQFAFLRSVGCDAVQGYFISQPLSTESATQLCIQRFNLDSAS